MLGSKIREGDGSVIPLPHTMSYEIFHDTSLPIDLSVHDEIGFAWDDLESIKFIQEHGQRKGRRA